jgi:phosphoribosylpyrophosphate synthetase
MIVVACSHGKHIAKDIAKKAKLPYSELFVEKFPDNEQHIKFQTKIIKNKIQPTEIIHLRETCGR